MSINALSGLSGSDQNQLRWLPIVSDAMEPTIRSRRDLAAVVPIESYDGEGLYVIDGPDIVRVTWGPKTLILTHDNPLYSSKHEVTREEFAGMVLGRVVGVYRGEA